MRKVSKFMILVGALILLTPGIVLAQAKVDWLHAEDISKMPLTTINYWYYETPERIALGKEQVKQFEKLFPNIRVIGRPAPKWVDNQALLAYIRTGTNSHVHQSVYNEDLWYIDHNLLLPLEDLPGFKDLMARLHPKANYVWRDGHVYSLSWYMSPIGILYNTKLVREAGLDSENPPLTYGSFLDWAKKLTKDRDGDGKIDQWAINPWLWEEWWVWEFIVSPFQIAATGSGDFLDPEGTKPIINNPVMIQMLKLFEELYRKGYAPRVEFKVNPFWTGQIAMSYPTLAEELLSIKRGAPPDLTFFPGPIPKPDDSRIPGNRTNLFVRNFALMREQRQKGEAADRVNRAAWEFMKFVLSPEQMAADFAVSGAIPGAADLSDPIFAKTIKTLDPAMSWFIEYAEKEGIIGDMTHVRTCDIMGILQKTYLEVIYLKKSPEEALAEAERLIKYKLERGFD